MRGIRYAVATAIGGMAIATAFASNAHAGCVDMSTLLTPQRLGQLAAPAAFVQQGSAGTPGSDNGQGSSDDAIVGLWQFQFTSVGNTGAPAFIPDGAVLDAGYTQWHSDRTEIMNSSRDPATSNFCLGVWKPSGHRSYQLNHFALSWDNTGTFCTPDPGKPSCFVGPTNIREQIAVDNRGRSYTGNVTITQYDTAGHAMFQLHGTIAAERLDAD